MQDETTRFLVISIAVFFCLTFLVACGTGIYIVYSMIRTAVRVVRGQDPPSAPPRR